MLSNFLPSPDCGMDLQYTVVLFLKVLNDTSATDWSGYIHPSIYPSITRTACSVQSAGAYPCTYWEGSGVNPAQVASVSQQQSNKWSKYVAVSHQRYHVSNVSRQKQV